MLRHDVTPSSCAGMKVHAGNPKQPGDPVKVLKIGFAAIAFLAICLFIIFQAFFRMAVPDYNGTLTLKGLQSTVEVRTDGKGVPHIYADNEQDLFFAQGYIMARERLFQMDMARLAARGELSTLLGDLTVDKDRFLRTIGLRRQAKKSYPAMSSEARQILIAFSKGVNSYIQTTSHLPREYFFLGGKPQLWEPEDSISVLLLMSYSMTRSKKIDLILNNIRTATGDEFLQQIMPSYPEFGPTLSGQRSARASGGSSLHPEKKTVARAFDMDFPYPLNIAASNWMIFSGKMTSTGKAMFAGSPDLAPTLPGLFYLMHIKGGDIDAIGGVLPGVPTLGPLGFNGTFAFSAVNGRGDEMDYFIEKINPDNPNQYLTENGYEDFRIIEEIIRIKSDNGYKSEKLTVKVSRHGPMISNVLPDAPENCAMQWSPLEIVNHDFEGLVAILKARNFKQFRAGASQIRSINLNLGYADVDGNIGWQFTAAPPIRKKGNGSLIVPGWTGEYDWQGIVPFEEVPWDLNPKQGYVASFNNDPGNVDYHLTNYYLFERAMRFEEIMKNRPKQPVDFAELKNMQLDTVSIVAERWTPLLIEACASEQQLLPYVKLMTNWNHSVDLNSTAATIFNYFYLTLLKNTLRDEVGAELWENGLSQEYIYYVPDLLLTRIRHQENHAFFDDQTTKNKKESRDDIIRKSMNETITYLTDTLGKDMDKWKWEEVHRMSFNHPLGSKLSFLNLDSISTNGSHHTINSGFWNPKKPFEMSAGGVIRMMVDFSDIAGATFISPPGQSGHYMSPHYDDVVDLWAAGSQIPMHYKSGKTLPTLLTLAPE